MGRFNQRLLIQELILEFRTITSREYAKCQSMGDARSIAIVDSFSASGKIQLSWFLVERGCWGVVARCESICPRSGRLAFDSQRGTIFLFY
jgi:hypothetical protein